MSWSWKWGVRRSSPGVGAAGRPISWSHCLWCPIGVLNGVYPLLTSSVLPEAMEWVWMLLLRAQEAVVSQRAGWGLDWAGGPGAPH